MTELSSEQKKKVEKIISQISGEENIDWWKARTLIHKCICGGKCGWYKTRSTEAGFDRQSITKEQRKHVEETINKVMKDMAVKKTKALIHEYICPSHPRPSE